MANSETGRALREARMGAGLSYKREEGRHIQGGYTPREAYTTVTHPMYTPWEAYTTVGTHPGGTQGGI